MTWYAYRLRSMAPALFRVNLAASILILLQALAGAAVVLSRLDIWSTLLHAGLMALLFVCLADACRQVLPPARAAEPARVSLTSAPATMR
jgi:heme A synthase